MNRGRSTVVRVDVRVGARFDRAGADVEQVTEPVGVLRSVIDEELRKDIHRPCASDRRLYLGVQAQGVGSSRYVDCADLSGTGHEVTTSRNRLVHSQQGVCQGDALVPDVQGIPVWTGTGSSPVDSAIEQTRVTIPAHAGVEAVRRGVPSWIGGASRSG